MNNKLQKKGSYEIFKTTEDHEILKLNKKDIYAIVSTNQGHILVATDEDHKKKDTLQHGDYFLVDFNDDPVFNDNPHLFVEKDDQFNELILPRGLPTNSEKRKKIIFTDENIDEQKIRRHLKNDKKKIESDESLINLEKEELDRKARSLGIKGYSNMKKRQLVKKIKTKK